MFLSIWWNIFFMRRYICTYLKNFNAAAHFIILYFTVICPIPQCYIESSVKWGKFTFWTMWLPGDHSNYPWPSITISVRPSFCPSICIEIYERLPILFCPWVYPMGSIVIALGRPLVRQLVRPLVRPSLNISETAHCFFLIFSMKVGYHKRTKVTEPDFWKKILGENPILGVFLMLFAHISASSH